MAKQKDLSNVKELDLDIAMNYQWKDGQDIKIISGVAYKKCSCCNKIFSTSAFMKGSTKTGYSNYCQPCYRAKYCKSSTDKVAEPKSKNSVLEERVKMLEQKQKVQDKYIASISKLLQDLGKNIELFVGGLK